MGTFYKKIFGKLLCADTTASTDKDTGSIITEGGIGAEGNINSGGDVVAVGKIQGGTGHIGDISNYSSFDTTGHLTMIGNARPWRDELGDILRIKTSGTGISIDAVESTVDYAYNAKYNATPASADYCYMNIQLNHDRDLASSIYSHIHWVQEKNYIPNFLLEYRWQINLATKTTSWTKLLCNTLAIAYTSGSINQICYANAISAPVGTALSDILQIRIYRDTDNTSALFSGADPYNTGGNASAKTLAFDVHFMLNSLGSTDEYTK